MNRLENVIRSKKGKCLSIYLTAGYPQLDSAISIVPELELAGVDFIELGIPFSDPMADGEVIQESSKIALENGMNLGLLFEQVATIRKTAAIPIVLMGYFNPILQYGIANFVNKCSALEIDGVLIPDLPIEVYQKEYKSLFDKKEVPMIFMVTPDSSLKILQKIEAEPSPFIYLVAKSAITGGKNGLSNQTTDRLKKFGQIPHKKSIIVGFGIHDKKSFEQSTEYFSGGIVGSEFIRQLQKSNDIKTFVEEFY